MIERGSSVDIKMQVQSGNSTLWQPWREMFSHYSESKLPNKELPTTKWRRERRRLSEYQTNSPTNNNNNSNNNNNMPTQVTIKSRSPPPYREPLPGSTFALTLLRPTVITVGPKVVAAKDECRFSGDATLVTSSPVVTAEVLGAASKRSETTSSSTTTANAGAVSPNGLTEAGTNQVKALQPQNNNNNNNTTTNNTNGSSSSKNDSVSESISMCDTVIDEHFRRSLGNNYMELFDAAAVTKTSTKRVVKSSPPPPPLPPSATTETKKTPIEVTPKEKAAAAAPRKEDDNEEVNFSVDDHFAKALGETWNKLKATHRREEKEPNSETEDDDMEDSGSEEDGDDVEIISRKSKRPRTDRRAD